MKATARFPGLPANPVFGELSTHFAGKIGFRGASLITPVHPGPRVLGEDSAVVR